MCIICKFLEWQREWENSKLYFIKQHIEGWESAHNSCRQCEVKFSKLCIGHTRLTHGSQEMTTNN